MRRLWRYLTGQDWRAYASILTGRRRENSQRARLLRGGGAILVIRVGSMGLGFISTLLLARLLGTEGYGVYALVLAWIQILFVLSLCGFESLIVREIALAQHGKHWPRLRGMLRFAYGFTTLSSVIIMIIAFLVLELVMAPSSMLKGAFGAGLMLVPLMVLSKVQEAALRGLQHIALGFVPDMLIRPLVLVVALLVVLVIRPGAFLPVDALVLFIAATMTALVAGRYLLRRRLPAGLGRHVPEYAVMDWLRSGWTLLLSGVAMVLNARLSILMLGWLGVDQAEIGIFAAAMQGSMLIGFFLMAGNNALGPVVAELGSDSGSGRNTQRLQRLASQSVRMIFLAALPVGIVLMVLSPWFMTLFGVGFEAGALVLSILILAQLCNIGFGSVGLLLTMSGHERDLPRPLATTLLLHLVLGSVLIPLYGMLGAALAALITTICWNGLLARRVRQRLGIVPHVFASLRR